MNWAILGGDMRMAELANQLAERGEQVLVFGFDTPGFFHPQVRLCAHPEEATSKANVTVLPLPVSRDKVTLFAPFCKNSPSLGQIFTLIPRGCPVFGGKASAAILEQAADAGHVLQDFLQREEFAVANALPTAEGAIQLAMEQLRCTLSGSQCLVTGYGRVAKILSELLLGLHAKVCVCARNVQQRTWSKMRGMDSIAPKELEARAEDFKVVFNTVPAPILSKACIAKFRPGTLLMELASEPGGFDRPLAEKAGLITVNAQGLPGKVAPVTGGQIILQTVENMLAEQSRKGE